MSEWVSGETVAAGAVGARQVRRAQWILPPFTKQFSWGAPVASTSRGQSVRSRMGGIRSQRQGGTSYS